MVWEDLAKTALLGTTRSQLSPPTLAALEQLGVDISGASAPVLLEAAALYQVLKKAAFPLQPYTGETPSFVQTTATRPFPGNRSIQHLQSILSGKYLPALPEFLALLARQQQQIPYEHLPQIFYLCLNKKGLWAQIEPQLGEVERWLLQQNPDWIAMTERKDHQNWSTASVEERCAMLRYLRRLDPATGLKQLQEVWISEDYKSKVLLLEELKRGLSLHDAPFLEDALNDSRKEVRKKAAEMTYLIPESAGYARLKAMVFSHLPLPSDLPRQKLPSTDKTNLEAQHFYLNKESRFKSGDRNNWFFDLLSLLSPNELSIHFGIEPSDCLRALVNSPFRAAYVQALAEAAYSHKNASWAEAIVRHVWKNEAALPLNAEWITQLFTILPESVIRDMMWQYVQLFPGLLEEDAPIIHWMQQRSYALEGPLCKTIINGFRTWLNEADSYYWNIWHYKKVLQLLAWQCPVELWDFAKSGWNQRSPVWPRWEKEIDRFLRILEFRKQMNEAFNSAPSPDPQFRL
ncbi:MAG TPA: DUF5691 domain-containing protein [Saprospiraceae bacterium]|nr:DUF5691 domain-containing protein [Saprospiraceae bacterium]HMQ85568.1 DUF5691 domain-containing protein [Saprospiraceae bacterium]